MVGLGATAIGMVAATVVLWGLRGRSDPPSRATRYRMLGVISLGLVIPARLLFEQRVEVIPWLALLVLLVGGGAYLLSKSRRLDD